MLRFRPRAVLDDVEGEQATFWRQLELRPERRLDGRDRDPDPVRGGIRLDGTETDPDAGLNLDPEPVAPPEQEQAHRRVSGGLQSLFEVFGLSQGEALGDFAARAQQHVIRLDPRQGGRRARCYRGHDQALLLRELELGSERLVGGCEAHAGVHQIRIGHGPETVSRIRHIPGLVVRVPKIIICRSWPGFIPCWAVVGPC